jgi:hypothetical protein
MLVEKYDEAGESEKYEHYYKWSPSRTMSLNSNQIGYCWSLDSDLVEAHIWFFLLFFGCCFLPFLVCNSEPICIMNKTFNFSTFQQIIYTI